MKLGASVTGADKARAELLRLGSMASRVLAATAEDVEAVVETAAAKHSKSGALVRSIYKRRVPGGWEIGHDQRVAPHALFVHWGTRPHVIRPKRKKVLRWPAGAAFAFARKVHHPGYNGDPWLIAAAREAPRIFERHLQQALARNTGA